MQVVSITEEVFNLVLLSLSQSIVQHSVCSPAEIFTIRQTRVSHSLGYDANIMYACALSLQPKSMGGCHSVCKR